MLVDEAHNFGANNLKRLLTSRYDYRLALSATLDRHCDPEGTRLLLQFFGEKCIEYSLEKAIHEDKLTPYKYYPIIVSLSEAERENYDNLIASILENAKDVYKEEPSLYIFSLIQLYYYKYRRL